MHSALELTWCGTTMNSDLKISELSSIIYGFVLMDPLWKDFDFCIYCFYDYTFWFFKKTSEFFHWIYQTFGASRTLFTEEILCVGISLVNKVPDLYFHIAYTVEICVEQLDYRLLPAFQFRNAILLRQLVILFRSKWNSLRQILTVRSTYFTPCEKHLLSPEGSGNMMM